MKARVLHRSDNNVVSVMVRRNYIAETLEGTHEDLNKGDIVEVIRRTNNPYLIRVDKTK